MVSGLNLNSDPNDIWKYLANAQGWGQAFPDGEINLDKLPPQLKRKIEAQRDQFLAEGDPNKIDTEAEIKKFSELLGQELKNIPGAPPGFDPELLAQWLLSKGGGDQNKPTGGQDRGPMGGQQFGNVQPASFKGASSGGGGGGPSSGGGGAPTSGGGGPSGPTPNMSGTNAQISKSGTLGELPPMPQNMNDLSPHQKQNAETIIAVGKEMGMSDRDIKIALMTAMQESHLGNLSMGDRDSLGLFQQRPSQGWGSPDQVTTPEYAARKFYDGLKGVAGREGMSLTAAAQAVQKSALPDAYAAWDRQAGDVMQMFA